MLKGAAKLTNEWTSDDCLFVLSFALTPLCERREIWYDNIAVIRASCVATSRCALGVWDITFWKSPPGNFPDCNYINIKNLLTLTLTHRRCQNFCCEGEVRSEVWCHSEVWPIKGDGIWRLIFSQVRIYMKVPYSVPFRFEALSIVGLGLGLVVGLVGSVLVLFFCIFLVSGVR